LKNLKGKFRVSGYLNPADGCQDQKPKKIKPKFSFLAYFLTDQDQILRFFQKDLGVLQKNS
jgi:hypothetical protein